MKPQPHSISETARRYRDIIVRRIGVTVEPQIAAANDTAQYVCTADLMRRWHYTKQGIHKLQKRQDFPAPATLVAAGRMRLWAVKDIEAYERDRPELHSEAAKLAKMRGFYRARHKKAAQPT